MRLSKQAIEDYITTLTDCLGLCSLAVMISPLQSPLREDTETVLSSILSGDIFFGVQLF